MYNVYKHVRTDTNEVFYIGIGCDKRPLSFASRNKYWRNIVKKVKCTCTVLHRSIDWTKACELERYYIRKYGRKDLGTGTLVNMTDGGEGTVNLADESRRKKSISMLGNKNGVSNLGPDAKTRDKMREPWTLRRLRGVSLETRNKMSLSMKGNKNRLGKQHSEDVKSKMRLSQAMINLERCIEKHTAYLNSKKKV